MSPKLLNLALHDILKNTDIRKNIRQYRWKKLKYFKICWQYTNDTDEIGLIIDNFESKFEELEL